MYNVCKTALNKLFECREEELCALTESDKVKIKRLVTKNDTYTMLLEKIDELSDDEKAKEKVKDSLDSYIDRVNVIGSYENEKFYKIRICRCNEFDFWMYRKVLNKYYNYYK